ncbi:hypothetical protein Acit_04555, partial [Aciditerrimonas ferrireducens]
MTELRTQTARAPGGATAPATAAPAAVSGAPGAEALPIVPVRGLPVVGLVLAGLVAAIATNGLWSIDFFHVVAGGIWTTLDLFLGFVLGPILARLSVPARVELTRRLMPKLLLIMPTVVLCTLAAGWQLARHEGNLLASSPNHPWVVASMIVVAVMAVVALGILEPANLAVLFELRR